MGDTAQIHKNRIHFTVVKADSGLLALRIIYHGQGRIRRAGCRAGGHCEHRRARRNAHRFGQIHDLASADPDNAVAVFLCVQSRIGVDILCRVEAAINLYKGFHIPLAKALLYGGPCRLQGFAPTQNQGPFPAFFLSFFANFIQYIRTLVIMVGAGQHSSYFHSSPSAGKGECSIVNQIGDGQCQTLTIGNDKQNNYHYGNEG